MSPLSDAKPYDHADQDAASLEEIQIHQESVESPKENVESSQEVAKDVSQTPKQSCITRGLLIRVGIVLVIIIAVALALLFVLAPPGGPKEWFIHSPPPGLSAAQRWDNGGYGGLSLKVLNAVDSNYQTLFYSWIQRWDNGTPDALSLTTQKVAYESGCVPVDGVLKVCNGNYGATGWRGIDLSTLFNGYIVNSVVKMNDFYLASEGEAWKEYTMCHELGHGWGLPHTDENVYNSNRGDCLDLTLNPVGDIQPGSYNFNLLAQMYGTVNGSVNATMINNSTASGTSSFGRTRNLRRGDPREFLRRLDALPHRALFEARYLSTVKAFGEGNLCDTLTGSKTGCVIDLGHGYTLGAHIFPSDL